MEPRRILQGVMSPLSPPREWNHIVGALWEVISVLPTDESLELMQSLLEFQGRFNLTEGSEVPHSLSPEDMVKSLVIQAMGKWAVLDYIPLLELVESIESTGHCHLASVARTVLKNYNEETEQ